MIELILLTFWYNYSRLLVKTFSTTTLIIKILMNRIFPMNITRVNLVPTKIVKP